jgi:hypothetical protein
VITALPPAARRRLGLGLFAFGAVGVTLVLAGLVLVLATLSAVDDAATSFERQRAQLLAIIEPARASLADAATGATNASTSLAATGDVATRAARLTDELASSFDGLAALGSVDILGAKPFASSASQFAAAASDARALSADLTTTASSMQANVRDSTTVANDLRSLSVELDQLQSTLGAGPTDAGSALPGPSVAIEAARLVLIGLLAWMAVPAIASLWLGWRLRRFPSA